MSQQDLTPATPQWQAPEPSWFQKNQKWLIPVIIAAIVLCCCLGALALAIGYYNSAPQSAAPIQPPVDSPQQPPTEAPVAPAATSFSDLELYTVPNPVGVYQIPAGTIAAVWWHVTLNGSYTGDCVGSWLSGGSTYDISSPGRISVWTSPQPGDLPAFKAWWEQKVQAEAASVCTYSWVEK